jgi:CRISPR-associated protein Cas2
MNGFGDSLQYSVFICDLSDKELIIMEGALSEIINAREDRVLIIDIGPASGRGENAVKALGRQLQPARPREVQVI